VVSVWATKGGVGKTTLALNLSAGLAALGHRVLLCDLDEQGSVVDFANYAKKQGHDLGFQVVKGLPKAKPSADFVLCDYSPKVDKDNLPVGELVIVPSQPGALDYWATQKMLGKLKSNQQVIHVLNRVISSRKDDKEVILSMAGALVVHDRSVMRRVLAQGKTIYSAGLLDKLYGARESKKELDKIIACLL